MASCAGTLTIDPPPGASWTCPLPVDQQIGALAIAATTAFLALGGLFLFWLRRETPLVAKRDWISTLVFFVTTVLANASAYLGKSEPCWSLYALGCAISALIPGVMLARFIGLFTRHLQQAEAVRERTARVSLLGLAGAIEAISRESGSASEPHTSHANDGVAVAVTSGIRNEVLTAADSSGTGNETSSDNTSAPLPISLPARSTRVACAPESGARTRLHKWWSAYATLFSSTALRWRLDNPRRSVALILVTGIPWGVYLIIRLAATPSHRSIDTGCGLDGVDIAMSALISALALVPALPAFLILLRVPDVMLLRVELALQMATWPPLIGWLLYDLSLPAGKHLTTLKG